MQHMKLDLTSNIGNRPIIADGRSLETPAVASSAPAAPQAPAAPLEQVTLSAPSARASRTRGSAKSEKAAAAAKAEAPSTLQTIRDKALQGASRIVSSLIGATTGNPGILLSTARTATTQTVAVKPEETFVQETHADAERRLGDGLDASRNIVKVEAHEGQPHEPYTLRVEMAYLKPLAEKGGLDLYWLIGTGAPNGSTSLPDGIHGSTKQPWNVAVCTYDGENSKVTNAQNQVVPTAVKSVKFDSVRRTIDVQIDKEVLRQNGWKDAQPLSLTPFTAKEFDPTGPTDTADLPGSKPWQKDGTLTRVINTGFDPAPLPAKAKWDGESIYFAFTDRFNQVGPNLPDCDRSNMYLYHGGNIQGITEKLDYLKDNGMTAIWISPVVKQQTHMFQTDGYHGYWAIDFYDVDPHQGNVQDVRTLCEEAHKRGMKIVLDHVVNHTGWAHPWAADPEKKDWFHQNGDIKDFENNWQMENCSLLGMPDFNQDNPEVYKELLKFSKFWIDQGIDGFRLDTIKNMPMHFWKQFTEDIRAYAGPDFLMMGEAFTPKTDLIGSYQSNGVQSLLDYPLYWAILDSLAQDKSMKILADKVAAGNADSDNPRMLSAFLDNHDNMRFMDKAGENGREKLKQALAFLMTIDRIPNVYYGTEAAMKVGHAYDAIIDPQCRADMKFGADPDMEAYFSKVANLRRDNPVLTQGGYLETWKDDQVFAYERAGRDESALVVLNGNGGGQHREIPCRPDGNLKEGARMKDALTGNVYQVRNGKLTFDLGPRQSIILLPEKQ